MSSYHIHSGKFDRNQFRVLFDWFDFIHRCFFHSCWSCPLNQAVNLWLRIVHWLAIDQDRFDRLFVCFKPIHDPNAWFYDYQTINPVCLIMMFSLPFLQWYWIRIFVPINQPFISIIMIISYDPTITYWTFTNDNDSNLPILTKWWFELGTGCFE